jgi:cell division protein ZapE
VKPSQKYQLLMEQAGFVIDPAQQRSVVLLDGLYQRVVEARPSSWWRGLLSKQGKWSRIKGLYFWGGVGRGKTLLMDIFYQSLPAEVPSERTHFHSFMNRVHASLQQHGNIENPLQQVARDIAAKTRVPGRIRDYRYWRCHDHGRFAGNTIRRGGGAGNHVQCGAG